MDTSVNAANQVVSVGADIAFDADPKFFACLVRFESSSVPTTLPTAYDVILWFVALMVVFITVRDVRLFASFPRRLAIKFYFVLLFGFTLPVLNCGGWVCCIRLFKR